MQTISGSGSLSSRSGSSSSSSGSSSCKSSSASASRRMTSVEEIFQFELLFAKFCGGFHYEWLQLPRIHRRWLSLAYRVAIVIVTRYLTPKHFMTSPSLFNETIGQVSLQNFKLFYYVCQTIGYLMVFVNIHNGFKSHQLMSVLLKKRFEAKYLTHQANYCSIADAEQDRDRDRDEMSIVTKLRLIKSSLFRQRFNSNGGSSNTSPPPQFTSGIAEFSFVSVSVTRGLLWINVLLATYSVYVHRQFQGTSETSIQMGEELNTSPSTATILVQEGPRLMFVNYLTNLLVAFFQASLNLCQMYGQIFVALLVTSSISDMLRYAVAHDEFILSNSDSGTDPSPKASPSSSTLELSSEPSTRTSGLATTISVCLTSGSYSRPKGVAHRPEHLLTAQVLLQAREVLLVVRHTVGNDYLLVLLFDLARFGAVFCLLDESIFNSASNHRNLPLIAADFALVFMSIVLTRFGHRLIHFHLEQLIQSLEKTAVLANWNEREYESILTYSARSTLSGQNLPQSSSIPEMIPKTNMMEEMRKSDQLTALKLAQEIVTIWPTDWYTPDYKSCMEQIIYVITFVATFHQLAEASVRENRLII